jgi:hypothetical protein
MQNTRPDGDVRGACTHQFRGDRVGRRLKNESKWMTVLINYFFSGFTHNSIEKERKDSFGICEKHSFWGWFKLKE